MLWIPYLLLVLLGQFCKNSKTYDFSVILFMGFLAWLNTSSADYASVYLPIYYNPFGAHDMDPGWAWLCYFGSEAGLTYNGFSCIVVMAAMVLYREFGRRIGSNTSFMLALFLIYPGLMSLVQLRQFVACSVACFAFALFWTSDKKMRHIFFPALMLISFSLHRSSVVLLFALFPEVLTVAGRRGRILVALVLTIIGFGLLSNWKDLSIQLFGENRTSVYLGATGGANAVSTLGGMRNALILVLAALLPYCCCRYIAKMRKSLDKGVLDWMIGRAPLGIIFLNAALLVLIPVVFLTNDFMRFERHGLTMALGLFAMMPSLEKRSPLLSCKALYVAVCLVFAYFYVANSFDSVYTALLNPNGFPPFFM